MARTKVFDEQEVLEKALNLFWEKGYNATSAQDLVDTLGISRSSMYDTYGDKHSLFIQALQQYRKERIDPLFNGVDDADDIEQYIKDVFIAVKLESLSETHAKGCFMVNSSVELAPSDDDVAIIVNNIMKDTITALTKAIKKGQKIGVFTNKFSAQSLAQFVFNSLNGLRVTVKLDTNKKMFEDIVNICLATLKG